MYGKCEVLEDARNVFGGMLERTIMMFYKLRVDGASGLGTLGILVVVATCDDALVVLFGLWEVWWSAVSALRGLKGGKEREGALHSSLNFEQLWLPNKFHFLFLFF